LNDLTTVMELFGQLSGLSEDRVRTYRSLCEASAKHIRQLSDGIDDSGGGKTAFAAAALAYYRYVLLSMTDGSAGSVKVGEISVQGGENRLRYAERLYREALAQLGSGLADEEFVFEVM